MRLTLQNIIPAHVEINDSQIWKKEVTIAKGDHLHIIAPSGKGKSTLLHFIYGLRADYEGRIFLNDEELKKADAEKKAAIRRKKLSIVFQDLQLFPELTIKENIEVKRKLIPYHKQDQVYEMAELLGIESKLNQKTKHCSYGEQQRAAIIRALMQPFDFLLLDEPFSHLDEMNRIKAMSLIFSETDRRNASLIFADLEPSEFFPNEKSLYL